VQPLAQRVLRRQRLQLADQPGVLAEGQLGLDPVLDRAQAQLVQAGRVGRGERLTGEVRQRRSAPQLVRLAQRGGGLARTPGAERPVPVGGQALEAQRVHLVGSTASR
jgi:hypothetical protein